MVTILIATGAGGQELSRGAPPKSPPNMPSTQPGGRAHRFGRMTAEQEVQMLEFLRQQRPEHHVRLMKLKEADPERYRRALWGTWRWYRRWQQMSEEERSEERARREVGRMVRQLRNAKGDERALLREELRQAIEKHFTAEQAMLEHRLKQLEDRIAQLREDIKQRAQLPGKVVTDRLERWLKTASQSRRSTQTQPATPRH